ncbi:MAG: hypothetical protein H6753_03855 [Candidatus Omnitrophica bacterium]|nr:hypothetical protein [Candidatus Omnitrophota bacterium]
MKLLRVQIVVLLFALAVLLLNQSSLFAESMDLIKDEKVVAGAIATFEESYSEDVNKRLFRATVIINQALIGLSCDELTEERFNAFTSRIHLLIDEKLTGSDFVFRFEEVSAGQELHIVGKTVDAAEKAAMHFLKESLKLTPEEVQALTTYVDQVMKMQDQQAQITAMAPVFQKVENLKYE